MPGNGEGITSLPGPVGDSGSRLLPLGSWFRGGTCCVGGQPRLEFLYLDPGTKLFFGRFIDRKNDLPSRRGDLFPRLTHQVQVQSEGFGHQLPDLLDRLGGRNAAGEVRSHGAIIALILVDPYQETHLRIPLAEPASRSMLRSWEGVSD